MCRWPWSGRRKILKRLVLRMSVPAKRQHTFVNIKIEEDKVTEGSAVIRQPNGQVFYNPVQQFNRDLSVCVISAFQAKFLAEPKVLKRFPVLLPHFVRHFLTDGAGQERDYDYGGVVGYRAEIHKI